MDHPSGAIGMERAIPIDVALGTIARVLAGVATGDITAV